MFEIIYAPETGRYDIYLNVRGERLAISFGFRSHEEAEDFLTLRSLNNG